MNTISCHVQAEEVEERTRHLFLDVSDLANADRGTGIQRVAKSILREWLVNPPKGYRVEPVYMAADDGRYHYASHVREAFLGSTDLAQDGRPVDFRAGDIFLGVDLLSLNPAFISEKTKAYFAALREQGVNVRFVVYDLLPMQMPQYFPDGEHRDVFLNWLRIVSEASGAVCISRSVTEDLKEWLPNVACIRSDFVFSYFHQGADIESSPCSTGLPETASLVLSSLEKRPSFLVVGTIEPRKGHRQVLDAFDWLWQRDVDVNLVFVGQEGWMVDELVQRIRSHPEKERRFFWLNGISDEYLLEIYKHVSCLLASSEGEGFGLPTVEAARFGVPIIARDIPVNREICGENARYFAIDAPDVLGELLLAWLGDWKSGVLPDSSWIEILSWREAAANLFVAVTTG